MLPFLIVAAFMAHVTVTGGNMCTNGDNLGPDNLIAYLHSNETITLDVDKAGQVRSFASNKSRFKLRFSSTAKGSDPGLGLFYKISGTIIKYSTNGSVTCHNPKYYKPSNCAYATKQFQGLKYFSQDKNITRITGTRLSDGRFLFSVHTINQAGTADYFQVLLRKDGLLASAKKCSRRTATALASIGVRNGAELLIVAFDELIGIQEYNRSADTELAVSRTINYQTSRALLGCEVDYCFDGAVDGATGGLTEEDIVFYRSFSRVSASNKRSQGSVEVDSIEKFVSQSLPTNFYHISSLGNKCTLEGLHTYECDLMFKQLHLISPQGTIDAIFALQNTSQLFLLSGDKYMQFHESGLVFTFEKYGRLSDHWLGLPPSVDGATVTGDQVIFILDNFVYRSTIFNGDQFRPVLKVSLIQDLFSVGYCTHGQYKKSPSAQKLNISTIEQFRKYRMQFEPVSRGFSKPSTTTSTTTSKSLKHRIILYIILLLLCLIALMVCTIILWFVAKSFQSVDETLTIGVHRGGNNIPTVTKASASQMSITNVA
ncbi:hypothetical protein HDE_01569 [Halotydeus destructor]|nr:hypothetical protein HDE_01569 [Halotydeus destructor]